MFLHHTMTDQEILRTCEGCDSQHLRLVADRLRARLEDLRVIDHITSTLELSHDVDVIREGIGEIRETAQNGE